MIDWERKAYEGTVAEDSYVLPSIFAESFMFSGNDEKLRIPEGSNAYIESRRTKKTVSLHKFSYTDFECARKILAVEYASKHGDEAAAKRYRYNTAEQVEKARRHVERNADSLHWGLARYIVGEYRRWLNAN